MKEKILSIASQVVVESFEKTAFMFLEECGEYQEIEGAFYATIHFESELGNGFFQFESQKDFALELCSNLLGNEDVELGHKCLLEMLNISAGHLLTETFGYECKTHLGIPVAEAKELSDAHFLSVGLMSDGGNRINLHVEMESIHEISR